jgi:predicted RNA-binding Zn-ribbon protein involved in translation (DUF1610 family)
MSRYPARDRYSLANSLRRERAAATDLFEGNGGHAGKIRCTACGVQGYPGGSWMDAHIAGHVECPDCGKVVAVASLRRHQSHRSHPKVES